MLLYFVFLLVFFSNVNSNETLGIQKKSFKLNCKNIKCPPIEDPVCVRIKNMNEKNKKITYIVAINKCEIQYAKCRPGVDAIKVDMENCLHDGRKNASKKRIKRDASIEMPGIAIFVAKNNSKENVYDKEEDSNLDDKETTTLRLDNDEIPQNSDVEVTYTPETENKKLEADEDVNHLPADYDHLGKGVDYEQYEKDCPTVCPARQVMLCAKCQHNIYRTFLSPCHLRLFHCKYPDEKLELVTRQPCMQSAPFLTNFGEAQGIVTEPGDQDDVLKFIYCRDKGRLGIGDRRCKFDET